MEAYTDDEIRNLKQEIEKFREIPRTSKNLANQVSNLLNVNDIMQLGTQLLLLKNALQEYDKAIDEVNK